MTLEDFVESIRNTPEQFAIMWQEGHAIVPDDWPMEMGEGDWFEQFLIWLDTAS